VRRSGRAARLAVVGSVAEGTRDLFSDLDLLVACDRPRSDGEAVLAAIHAAVPVLCRRLFPDREPPSGRYWFRDHLPPNKLDVSFHRPGELRRLAGDMAGHGLAVRIVELDPDPSAAAPPRTPWVEVPGDLADELHRVSRALRRYARSGEGRDDLVHRLGPLDALLAPSRRESLDAAVLLLATRSRLMARAALSVEGGAP
jgi:hypothetical protein